MTHVKLTHDPLDLNEIVKRVTDPECGAIDIFMGTTRDTFDGKNVVHLEYEAYESMALKELNHVCEDCRQKFKVKKIAVEHRLGLVPVMEASIIIAVSSEHRRDAMNATRYLIDAVKSGVPIWKKEYYTEDRPSWKENSSPSDQPPIEGDVHYHSDIECDVVMDDINNYDADDSEDYDDDDDDFSFTESDSSSSEEDKKPVQVDDSLIQIRVQKPEVRRRIKAFQKKKRHDLNLLNKVEFCQLKNEDEDEENSCARTNAVILRPKGSSSHLKHTKVHNEWGPQTTLGDLTLEQGASAMAVGSEDDDEISRENQGSGGKMVRFKVPEDIKERVSSMEEHLKMNTKGKKQSIHSRIKELEDRMLYLESISPEYFKGKSIPEPCTSKKVEKRPEDDDDEEEMTTADVEERIFALKKKLKSKQLGHDL